MGEYMVGAYLKIIKKCDFVDYNVRPPTGGLEGLQELDVVGLVFKTKTAYLCEVTTHIRGVLYKDNKTTIERIRKKYDGQKRYSRKHLKDFDKVHYMFWSPVVPEGYLTKKLKRFRKLECIYNEKYTECINELRQKAKKMTNDVGNPFFHILQIVEHLR